MRWIPIIILLIVLVFTSECGAYRILAVFPFAGKSHNILFDAMVKGLAKRGHQMDVITHFPFKKPVKNYNNIINLAGSMENLMNNYTIEFVASLKGDLVKIIAPLYGNRLCHFMGFESMQNLIKNPPTDPPYDLVLVEAFCANCYMGLGYIFKVPVVAVSSAVEYPWVSYFIGNNDNPVYVPNAFQVATGRMTFWERLNNFLSEFIELRKFHSITEDSQTESMKKYLSPDIPNIREVEKNVALTLVNSHPIVNGIKPITPMLVQIAGLHIDENDETLTPELQKWMNESKHGVVYFTLGSMVLIETLPAEQLKEIYDSFKKIAPMRVLMKIVDESKLPPGLPENVKVLPWIPQIPVLAHPNTKIFITHGGLGGLLEGLYFGVPMIGLPLFSDQFRNCKLFRAKDMLLQLQFKEFSGEKLDSALAALIHNSTYRDNAIYYSKLFRDQPIKPMDSANFWIEYVIRNGPVLKSPALDFTWWQLALLDVYALILSILILSFIIIIFSIRMIFRILHKILIKSSHKSTKNQKKIQ